MAVTLCSLCRRSGIGLISYFLLTSLFTNGLIAQSAELAYRNYSIDDGLPSSECYEIIQDREGYIWISTDNGVSKFNGDHLINYGPNEGLKDKTVLFMHEDHRGWIWMSTLSGNCYIYRSDTIAAFEYNHLLQQKRNDYSLIHDFIIDTSGNAHFALSHHSIFQITPDGDTLSWKKEQFLFQVGLYKREGKILQLTEHNYGLPLNDQQKNISVNDPNFPKITHIEIEFKGSRQSSKLGSYVFQVDDHIFFQHFEKLCLFDNQYQLKQERPFSEGGINCIYQLKSGQILIGLFDSRGLLIYDSIASLFRGDPGESYFSGNTISHITQGKDGSIWIATTENGIYYIPSLAVKTHHFELGKANFIEAQASQNDEVFFGVANGQVFKKSNATDWLELPKARNLYRLDNMKYYEKENLLVVNSPIRYLRNTPNANWQKPAIVPDIIFTGYIDNLNKDIIGFNASGIISTTYDGNQLAITQLEQYGFSAANCIAQTHPDSLWLGSRSGLFLLGGAGELHKVKGFSNLLDVNIRYLKVYQDSSLLIGTKNYGMLRLKNGVLDQISTEQGLLDNTIDRIRVDNNGHIWLTSKQGLNRLVYRQDSLFVNTITTLNGLPSNEVIDVTFSENKIWVVGKQWVTSFPADFEFDAQPLQVKIAKIQVNGKEYPLQETITLDWNNSISLHFTAFNYHAYKNQSYHYRLHPTDDWLATNQPVVNFSNLAPGNYQFEIQAQQKNQLWGDSTIVFLRVRPPFWQRWGFILPATCFLIYLVYYLSNQKVIQLKQERKQIELEDQINQFKQQAYRAQMNPHFVFNCLNAIQGFIIGGEQEQKKAARLLARFSDLMRQALDASRKESISLTEEVRLLNNYLSLEQMRFDYKFDYHIQLEPDLESDWIQIPPMLVQPYVENAVVHGVASLKNKGLIRLNYRLVNETQLEVSIEDNGPGISYTKGLKQQQAGKMKRESVGMSIAQQRLEILSSRSNNVEITETRHPDGSISGTLIKVQIPLNS